MDEGKGGGGRATGPGLLLLACGLMLTWMGVDLLTGGALTRLVSGGVITAAGTIEEGGQDVRTQN
jgi:hypothetical protein